MTEFRYFYYLVAVNMLANVIMFTPTILLRERFEGAVSAILLAVPIGTALLVGLMYSLRQFPKQGLPEILDSFLPKWLRLVFLLHLIMMWFLAGAVTLLSISEMANRFILPEMGRLPILALFTGLALLAILLKSSQLLYGVEVLFWINAPLIAFILAKALFEPTLSWRAMLEVAMDVRQFPSLGGLSAATFIYTGYLNMVVFNKTIQGQLHKLPMIGISAMGFLTLLTSFFIPIGIHGTFAVADFPFPWVFTADSLMMEFFFIERVVFPFLLLYIMVSLMSVFIHWHVGLEIVRETFTLNKRWGLWAVLGGIAAATVVLEWQTHEERVLFNFASIWLIVRLLSEAALVVTLLYGARRVKRDDTKKSDSALMHESDSA